LAELKAKGISQAAFAETIGMNPRHLGAVKSSKKRNHFFNELGAIKLACLWMLEHVFVNRKQELDFLSSLLTRNRPGPAQLVLMYGCHRVGKSELLMQWAAQSGLPFTYWKAVKETATQQRARLFARLLNVPVSAAPVYRSWPELWDAAAPLLQAKRQILIMDELTYAAEADSAMLLSLQYAWDQ